MKVVCAWCTMEIGEVPHQDGSQSFEVTHGICKSCKDFFFGDRRLTLDQFLNRLEAPVLMVNTQGEIMLANDKALRLLNKDLESVIGFRGGDVMECAYARLPEGCGNTVHCAACAIRRSVMETFKTGICLQQVPAYLNRLDRKSVHKIKFLISTERVDDIVLLRIDEVVEK